MLEIDAGYTWIDMLPSDAPAALWLKHGGFGDFTATLLRASHNLPPEKTWNIIRKSFWHVDQHDALSDEHVEDAVCNVPAFLLARLSLIITTTTLDFPWPSESIGWDWESTESAWSQGTAEGANGIS